MSVDLTLLPQLAVNGTVPYVTWSTILKGINPFAYGTLGIAMAIGLSVVGAAWYGVCYAVHCVALHCSPHRVIC